MCAGPQACVANRVSGRHEPAAERARSCNDGNAAHPLRRLPKRHLPRLRLRQRRAVLATTQGCNGVERCVNNTCVAGTPMVCGDGNVCNGTETCVNGACVARHRACSARPTTARASTRSAIRRMGCRVQTHPDGTHLHDADVGAAGHVLDGRVRREPDDACRRSEHDADRSEHHRRRPRSAGAQTPNTTCNTAFGRRPTCTRSSRATPETVAQARLDRAAQPDGRGARVPAALDGQLEVAARGARVAQRLRRRVLGDARRT